MGYVEILKSKEKKELFREINKQFGSSSKHIKDLVFFMKKNKIFVAEKSLFNINLEKLRINSLGLYFGEKAKDGLRLSIEGSQIIGKYAKKNVLELTKQEAEKWMKGYDLEINKDLYGYFLVKYKNYFLGCGKAKNGKLLNYVPKQRRIFKD